MPGNPPYGSGPQQTPTNFGGQGTQGGLYPLYPQQQSGPAIPFTDHYSQQPAAVPIGGMQQQHTYGSSEHLPQPGQDDFMSVGGMWSTAPASFEYEDWDNWVSRADPTTGIMTGQPGPQQQQQQQHDQHMQHGH